MMALSIASPAFGAACSTFANLQALLTAGTCDIGSVTFSGFTYNNSIAASAVNLTAAGTGVAGSFAGLALSTSGGFTTPFSLTYSVACVSCTFIGSQVNANIQPVFPAATMSLTYVDNGGTLTATATGQDQSHVLGGTGTSVSNVLNSGGSGDRLQSLQNNFYITPAGGGGAPEPTSLLLFGSGFLAVGLAARARRKARS